MKSKIVECVDCGKEFENKGQRRKPYCIECAYKRVQETDTQLHQHSGPYYEKWKQAYLRAAARL